MYTPPVGSGTGLRRRTPVRRHRDPVVFSADLGAPAGKPVELFVEGPTPQWALPIPKPVKSAPAGRAQFSFELDGLPPGADAKSPVDLTFTVVTGDRAVETKTHLD